MTAKPQLILASGSGYRKQQLNSLAIDFSVVVPDVDESPKDNESASVLAQRLALSKAIKVQSNHPGGCVIGSDQVCTSNGKVYGKPGSAANAIKQLQFFSNKRVEFYTALCVLSPRGERLTHTDLTTVDFRQLTLQEIERYVQKEQPLNCAGSFKVESLGLSLFDSVNSKDPSALMGLPLIALCDFLRQVGYQLP